MLLDMILGLAVVGLVGWVVLLQESLDKAVEVRDRHMRLHFEEQTRRETSDALLRRVVRVALGEEELARPGLIEAGVVAGYLPTRTDTAQMDALNELLGQPGRN